MTELVRLVLSRPLSCQFVFLFAFPHLLSAANENLVRYPHRSWIQFTFFLSSFPSKFHFFTAVFISFSFISGAWFWIWLVILTNTTPTHSIPMMPWWILLVRDIDSNVWHSFLSFSSLLSLSMVPSDWRE